MDDAHSDAAAQLIQRLSDRSRRANDGARPSTTQIDKLVINRADNCTFIFNATPEQVEDALRRQAKSSRGL